MNPGYPTTVFDTGEDFPFDRSFMDGLIKRIYNGELDQDVWKASDMSNKATGSGFGIPSQTDPSRPLYEELHYNNGVFSASMHCKKDIAAHLFDKNVEPKSFEQFRSDVPNLKWLPATSFSMHGRKDHEPFWNPVSVVSPIDDPFRRKHCPEDRWNCKCTLQTTNEAVTDILEIGDDEKSASGLDNNPAIDGKLFGNNHPYIKKAGSWAKAVVEKFIKTKLPRHTYPGNRF